MNRCELNLNFNEPDSCYLIKLGKREHLEQIRNGILRFKPLSFYRAYEKNRVIGDENEGAEIIVSNQSNIIATFNHPLLSHSIDFSKNFFGLKSFPPDKYISSFSYFTAEDVQNHSLFSDKMLSEEYDSILFIIDSIGFVKEIEKATKNYILRYGRVSYYNPKDNLYNLTDFYKTMDYEYQKEYRFSIELNQKQVQEYKSHESIPIPYKPVSSIIIPINEFKDCFKIIKK